ncbi:MAG: hypothetical protein AAGA56_17095, partial [Myxococcota bacterium]
MTSPSPLRSKTRAALVGALVASFGATPFALAQPTRTDRPLRTPKRAAAKKTSKASAEKEDAAPAGKVTAAKRKTKVKGGDEKAGGATKKASVSENIGIEPDISFSPPRGRMNFNMREAEMQELLEAVTNITGRRFIFGGKTPVSNLKATIISPQDL